MWGTVKRKSRDVGHQPRIALEVDEPPGHYPRISPSKKLPGITGSLKQARINKRYSKIRMAEAITVVHKPFLSPTADCVLFAVRTILFDIL